MRKLGKIVVSLSIVVLPLFVIFYQKNHDAYANASTSKYTVNAANVNVREEADISSKIISKVHQGDTFELVESKNGWDQVKLSGNQMGWINDAYLTKTENTPAAVEAVVLNVRQSPSLNSKVLGKLKLGAKIIVYEEHAGWAKIGSSTGLQGWVCQYYINKEAPVSETTVEVPSQQTDNTSDSSASNTDTSAPSVQTVFNPKSKHPLKGKTIVLDPGHGGKDDGTTSITGTHEKDLTLATAEAVQQKLENAGANVIMTRTDDTYISLKQRADLSKQNNADAFISFHYNWSNDPSANGLTDFYYQKSRDNALATDILNNVSQTTGLNTEGTKFDNLDVLRSNSQPSTLIELGFLSNKQDNSLVENYSYQEHVAQGVYAGLLDYFSGKN